MRLRGHVIQAYIAIAMSACDIACCPHPLAYSLDYHPRPDCPPGDRSTAVTIPIDADSGIDMC